MSYAQVVDPRGELLAALRLPGIPVTYALDRSGRILYRHVGEMKPTDISDLAVAIEAAD